MMGFAAWSAKYFAVWLYEAKPGPEFPIVYKDAQVSGWGPAYPQSISGTQPTY